MGRFDRGNDFKRGGGDFRKPREMFKTTCSKCGKDCEVPFRPTGGKPVYCSDCFDRNRDSDSPRSEMRFDKRPSYGDRPSFSSRTESFDAVCDECGKNCTVPFHPTEGKPIYCRECFGKMKNSGEGNNDRAPMQSNQYQQQFDALNSKLDKILNILESAISEEEVLEEEIAAQPEEVIVKPAKKPRTAKKAAA